MSTDRPAKSLYPPRSATAVKKGDVLQAEASHALNPDKKIKLQTYRRPVWDPYLNRWVPEWDPYLLRWFGTATEDETVEVVVHLDNDARPFLLEMRNHPEEDLDDLQEQETRSTAVNENGGFVNPYTFVPTPPRGDLAASGGTPEGAGSAGSASDDTDGPDAQGQHFPGAGAFDGTDPVPGPATGLADSGRTGPPSHALHGPEQWSGRLTLRLTARTPLLMPDQQRAQKDPQCPDRSVVATRTDPRTGRPLLPGTSVKGTLRSAFETVTASRFGVFGGHDLPLAYRTPARTGSELVPAVVVSREGRDYFQLCRGDEDWHPGHPEATEPEVQFAAWVPAYAEGGDPPRVVLAGGLRKAPSKRWSLKELHATVVHARVRLYRLSASDQPGSGMCRVWVVTHLADTPDSLAEPRSEYEDPKELGKSLYLVPDTEPRIVRGVLSASGRSIGRKEYERLFVTTPEDVLVPVTGEHRRFWVSVIEAYDEASRYHDPVKPLERSWHVGQADAIKGLPSDATEGFGKILPVYVGGPNGRRLGSGVVPGSPEAKGGTAPTILEAGEVTQVHPVMIGRLPFEASPADLLDPSLRPASDPSELSPADRLFGWSADGPDRSRYGGRESSGYRGRLAVRSVTCRDEDWRQELPGTGVVLAPLSGPKPTQFRFYAGRDPEGRPVRKSEEKKTGYAPGTGLRGRKHYRWSDLPAEYWEPRSSDQIRDRDKDRNQIEVWYGDRREMRYREYLDPGAAPKQTVRHCDWVRRGVTFDVEIFLDGVPSAELGALLWLIDRSEEAPLRVGSGKPYGFGVVTAAIVWNDEDRGDGPEPTALWDGEAVAEGWRSLARPAPATSDRLLALAEQFEQLARRHPLLTQTLDCYLAATRAVEHPIHYPRSKQEPMAESYEWFTENERVKEQKEKQQSSSRGKDQAADGSAESVPVEGWSLPDVRSQEPRLPILAKKQKDGSRPSR